MISILSGSEWLSDCSERVPHNRGGQYYSLQKGLSDSSLNTVIFHLLKTVLTHFMTEDQIRTHWRVIPQTCASQHTQTGHEEDFTHG